MVAQRFFVQGCEHKSRGVFTYGNFGRFLRTVLTERKSWHLNIVSERNHMGSYSYTWPLNKPFCGKQPCPPPRPPPRNHCLLSPRLAWLRRLSLQEGVADPSDLSAPTAGLLYLPPVYSQLRISCGTAEGAMPCSTPLLPFP